MPRPDLASQANIDIFVDSFYEKIRADTQLAPLFFDVAQIDLAVHLPHIKHYWYKLLLGDTRYQRHTMNIHRQLHAQRELQPADFQKWLCLFVETVDGSFSGERAERAKAVATSIAKNMETALSSKTP